MFVGLIVCWKFVDASYPDNEDLFWVIDSENGFGMISITISELDIEQSTSGYCYDYIEISDGGKKLYSVKYQLLLIYL